MCAPTCPEICADPETFGGHKFPGLFSQDVQKRRRHKTGLEAKGKGAKDNQAMRLCMKSTRGMPLVVRPIVGKQKKWEKNKQENLRSGSTKVYSVEALCGQGLWFCNGDVKVLLIQRSSHEVLLTKRSGNQVLPTKRWKGYACTSCLY